MPMPNGFCVFNAMSYCINGSNYYASDYVGAYENDYGTSGMNFNSSGVIVSFNFEQDQLLDFVQEQAGSYYNVSQIDGGVAGINTYLNQNNGYRNQVMAGIVVNGYNHEVVITSVNSNGTYNYYDPTENTTILNASGAPSWVMGLKNPLYAGSSGSSGY